MPNPEKIIKALGRWGRPTVERYRVYVEACQEYGIEPAPLMVVVGEVLNTPEDKRDWLLDTPETMLNYEPHVHYAVYDTPIMTEQIVGLSSRQQGRKR